MARKRNHAHLISHLSVFEPEYYPIQKGYAARLLIADGRTVTDVLNQVKAIVQANDPGKELLERSLSTHLYELKKLILHKKVNLTTEWQSLIRLFIEPLRITFKSITVAPATSQPEHTSPPNHSEPTSTLVPPSETLIMETETDTSQTPTTQSSVSLMLPSFSVCSGLPTPRKLKRDCPNCVYKKRAILNMNGKIRRLKEQVRELEKTSRIKQKPQFSLKRLNEKIKRKTMSAEAWKSKFLALKELHDDAMRKLVQLGLLRQRVDEQEILLNNSLEENKTLLADNRRLENQIVKVVEKGNIQKANYKDLYKTVIAEREQTKQLHEKVVSGYEKNIGEIHSDYENQISILKEKVEAIENNKGRKVIQTTKNGKYDFIFRQCIYDFLLHNVSVGNVCDLFRSIGLTLFESTFSELPCVSTVAQMAVELGVLAEVQVGQALDKCVSATLAWDATTKGGMHINEVHVSVANQDGTVCSLTMNVSYIAGGATKQILEHVNQALADVCKTYSCAFNLDDAEVRDRIFKKICCTMSDRAAANHCVHTELERTMGMGKIVELKCSLHPMDGLANAAKKVLHQMDVEKGMSSSDGLPPLGCRAVELIYQISRLRYKEGSGDPAAFGNFLKMHNVQPSIILRYVGNRLNVMFHMAATVHSLRDIIMKFVRSRQTRDLCMKIMNGLSDPSIQIQVQVLGLFSKYLTGPWMQFFYEPDGGRGYQLGAAEFQPCIRRLRGILATPEDLITTTSDVFGNTMLNETPGELEHLDMANMDEFLETVKRLAAAFIETLTRQLGDGSDGQSSNESFEITATTASAPMHNMHAERTLGMTDALIRRAPHAKIGFIDAKVKARQNKTLQWLRSHPADEQEKLIDFAIRQRPKVMQKNKERQKAVEKTILQRVDEQIRADCEKELKSVVDRVGLNPSLLDLDMFRNLDLESRELLKKFIVDDHALSSLLLRHEWQEDGKDVVYLEMVMDVDTRVRKDKLNKVIDLFHWKEDDDPSAAITWSITLKHFLVDFANGYLSFL